jgi:hypothetical protein
MAFRNVQATAVQPVSPQKFLSPVLRVALLLGVLVHLAGFLVFRVVSSPLPSREESRPFVQFVSPETLTTGAELEEQAALFDTAPLFIAGEWNAAHNLAAPRRDRGLQRFPPYQAEMDVVATLVPGGTSLGQEFLVRGPADLLDLRFWDIFNGLTLREGAAPEMEASAPFVEVRSLDGRLVQVRPIERDIASPSANQPVQYFLRVEGGGRALGRPTLSMSSGDTSFDAAAYNWIVESGLAAGLEPGFFEIRVFP